MEIQYKQQLNQQQKDHEYVKEKKGVIISDAQQPVAVKLDNINNDIPCEVTKQRGIVDLDLSLNSLSFDVTESDILTTEWKTSRRRCQHENYNKGVNVDGDILIGQRSTCSEQAERPISPQNLPSDIICLNEAPAQQNIHRRRRRKDDKQTISTSTETTHLDLSLSLNLSGLTEEGGEEGDGDCEIEVTKLEDTDDRKKLSRYRKNEGKINFWNQIVYQRITHYGMFHCRTAESLIDLGTELMNCKQYDSAIVSLEQGLQIFRQMLKKKSKLRIAKALDLIGVVASQAYRHLNKDIKYILRAKEALGESYAIRYERLGEDHVDTVETLNKIAGVHVNMKDFQLAKEEYHEVLKLRRAIYGDDHPSVAVTERCLGRIHLHLRENEEARLHFVNALQIFEKLGLNYHLFVEQIKNYLKRIGVAEARLEI